MNLIKYMYDIDIIEEDAILQYYNDCDDILQKKSLRPFVEWLNEADEESDEDD